MCLSIFFYRGCARMPQKNGCASMPRLTIMALYPGGTFSGGTCQPISFLELVELRHVLNRVVATLCLHTWLICVACVVLTACIYVHHSACHNARRSFASEFICESTWLAQFDAHRRVTSYERCGCVRVFNTSLFMQESAPTFMKV